MKTSRGLVLVIVILVISLLLYMPTTVQVLFFKRTLWSPLEPEIIRFYNEVFNVTNEFDARRVWLNLEKWNSIRSGNNPYVIPYLDYKLYIYGDIPAPPLITLLWASATYIALLLTGSYMNYAFVLALYIFQAVISLICLLFTFHHSSFQKHYKPLYPLLLVSLLVLAPYSLEVVSIPLLVLAFSKAENGEFNKAIFHIGLTTGFNYFLVVLFCFYLYKLLVISREQIRLLPLIGVLMPHIFPLMLNFQYYEWLISSFLTARRGLGLGNILVEVVGLQVAYRVIVSLWLSLFIILIPLTPRDQRRQPDYLINATFLLFAIYSDAHPQTFLPVLIAGIMLNRLKPVYLYLLVEFSNALIHVLYLKVNTLVGLFNAIGIQVPHDPFSLDNPIQWVTQFRNALLMSSSIITMYYILNEIVKKRNAPQIN